MPVRFNCKNCGEMLVAPSPEIAAKMVCHNCGRVQELAATGSVNAVEEIKAASRKADQESKAAEPPRRCRRRAANDIIKFF